MIEQALFFAMGFLVASLAAVVATPVISRRAMRLAEARARLKAPVTEKQAIAERDALRAAHAVEKVKLEHRLALAEDTTIALRAELGRKSVKIIALESSAAEHGRAVSDLEAALTASQRALNDAVAERDRAQVAEAQATARQSELEAEASRDRARLAILSARAESLEGTLEAIARSEKTAADQADKANKASTELVGSLEERLREAIARNQGLTESLSRADAERPGSARRLADAESRLERGERALEETLVENARLLAALAEKEAALARTAEPDGDAPGDAALREAIERLGREVQRLFAARESIGNDDRSARAAPFAREDADAAGPPLDADAHGFAEGPRRRALRSHAPDC